MPFNLLVEFQLFLEYNKLLFFLRSKSSSRMALSHRDEGVIDGSVLTLISRLCFLLTMAEQKFPAYFNKND